MFLDSPINGQVTSALFSIKKRKIDKDIKCWQKYYIVVDIGEFT